MPVAWIIRERTGDVGVFHSVDPDPQRVATFHTVVRRTLVLGSAQSVARVDRTVADALGVEIVQRRSGGGAVFLVPDEFVWLDLVIPAADRLWLDDVGQAMRWVGECWAGALDRLGVRATVHTGPLINTTWSRDVCFAGIGTGEVVIGQSKLVGVAQRRTREWARFQTMCHVRWRPEFVAALVAPGGPHPAELAASVTSVDVPPDRLRDALVGELRGPTFSR